MKRTVTLLLLAISVPVAAQQQDRGRTEALAARAAERLHALHREADRLAAQERTLLGDLRKLELERQIKTEEFKRIDAQATAAAAELSAVDDEVARLSREKAAQLPGLRARLVDLYKLGQAQYVRLLLSTADARSIAQASRMVAAIAKRDRDRLSAHQRRLADLSASRQKLDQRSRQLSTLREDAEKARAAADRAVARRNTLIKNIDEQRDLTAQFAGELENAQHTLQARLRDVAGGATFAAPATLPLRPFRGDLEWPVAGTVRERFGSQRARTAPLTGIEVTAPEGTFARAIHEGTVAFADTFAGYGNLVIVDHGAQTFSVYGNLQEIAVARGSRLDRGQPVGRVGFPVAGGSGLYFELRVDGHPVDPLQWLKPR